VSKTFSRWSYPCRFLVLAWFSLLMPLGSAQAQAPSVSLEEWMPGAFDQPTYVTNDGDERLIVVEQPGIVWVVADANAPDAGARVFLDLTDRVGSDGSEQGLLSIAFPPEGWAANVVFVSYTDQNGDSVVSRFDVAGDGMSAEPTSEQVVLTQDQPYPNHNGGLITFGPDGMLYIGFGDGGSQGDPNGNAQNLTTWLGKILRINVDPAGFGEEAGYVVPVDNPFVGNPEVAPEIWMYGLRNPWRFAFDPEGTMIAVADVGQSQIEEVTILPLADAPGANLGWNIMEGSTCYAVEDCDPSGLILPSIEYTHDVGGCSITGGYFIDGAYVYGDYCSGLVWLATPDGDGGWSAGEPIDTGLSISSFGLGGDGTVYLTDLASGSVYRVVVD